MEENNDLIENEDKIEEISIDEEKMKRFNEIMDKIADFFIDFDFVAYASLFYTENYGYINLRKSKDIVLKKFEIVLIALDFFKSIDKDFHKRVLNVVFGKYENIKFNIYKYSQVKDFDEMDNTLGFEKFRKHEKEPCNQDIDDKIQVYMPLEYNCKKDKDLSKRLEKDEGTIEDLYVLVHELSHTLDLFLDEDEIRKDGKLRNPNGDIFRESTAIGFQRALTHYLIKKGIISSRRDVENIYYFRANDTVNKCMITGIKLYLSRIKKDNGEVTAKDFNEIASEIKLTKIERERVFERILENGEDNINSLTEARYAFSGALSPVIESLIVNGEIEKVKKYIEAARNEKFVEALNALGITADRDGMKFLEQKMLETIKELYDDVKTSIKEEQKAKEEQR